MEDVLDGVLPTPEGPQAQIMQAMRYATLGGGKTVAAFFTDRNCPNVWL